jgi:hypothetical protein
VKPLKRWPEEGVTADELSLLQLSRRERAPVEARVRTLGALGAMSATTGATASALAAAGTSGLSALAKLAAVLGASLAAPGVVLHGRAPIGCSAAPVGALPRAVSEWCPGIRGDRAATRVRALLASGDRNGHRRLPTRARSLIPMRRARNESKLSFIAAEI